MDLRREPEMIHATAVGDVDLGIDLKPGVRGAQDLSIVKPSRWSCSIRESDFEIE